MALTLFEDTFLTVAEADSLLEGDLFWSAADNATKELALRDATSALNDKEWIGYAAEATQSLSWPREKFSFFDPSLRLYVEVPEGTVPRRLKKAIANLARHYTQFPNSTTNYEATYDRIKIGPLELEDTNASSSKKEPPKVPYYEVTALVGPLIEGRMPPNSWWRAN